MQFRLNETNIKISKKETMSKTLSKYTLCLVISGTLLVLSAKTGNLYITLFAIVICAPVGEASANLSLIFLNIYRIANKILKTIRKKIKNTINSFNSQN